jgi:D-amino-acid dehydrogenase
MRIVVVGGGVLGASTAFHLALAGAKVVLIDQAHAGRATAAGAGIVCPWASEVDDPDWHRIAQAGARYYPTLVELLAECGESELGYRRVGALCVAAEQWELEGIEQVLRTRHASAPEMGEVSRLSPEQARRLFPPLRKDLAAMHISGGARVDGRLLEAALRRGMERRGGRFQTGMAELLAEAGASPGSESARRS